MESGTLKILQAEGQVNLNNRSSYCILYLFFESDRKPEIKERGVGIKRAGSTFYRWEMIIYLLKSRHHSPFPVSGNPDTYHVHDLERHSAHCFTAGIIGQVNALTHDIFIGLLALESEGGRATLDHERVDNPVTLGSLHMRGHREHVRVHKLAVFFQ